MATKLADKLQSVSPMQHTMQAHGKPDDAAGDSSSARVAQAVPQ